MSYRSAELVALSYSPEGAAAAEDVPPRSYSAANAVASCEPGSPPPSLCSLADGVARYWQCYLFQGPSQEISLQPKLSSQVQGTTSASIVVPSSWWCPTCQGSMSRGARRRR